MLQVARRHGLLVTAALAGLVCGRAALAAAPTVEQALQLVPTQKDVEYDRPEGARIAECTIKAETVGAGKGWIVRDGNGQILRRFVDTNNDNVVDMWCYYHDGIEVYRDIDSNYNNKADQYRWLNTAGMRWGIDENEDGQIDRWQQISAEEASAELVAALAQRDVQRLTRLLLTPEELESLGVGAQHREAIQQRIAATAETMAEVLKRQQVVTPKTQWLQFGAVQPGIVPEGTDGSTRDLMVYENAVAIVQTGEKHGQLRLGTLVRVGDVWRVIDLPADLAAEGEAVAGGGGLFYRAAMVSHSEQGEAGSGGISEQVQTLLGELEQLDKAAAAATNQEQQARLNAQRADLLEKLAAASSGDDRAGWLRQLADSVSAAAQSGTYPDGVQRLEALLSRLRQEQDQDLAAYVKFRLITAQYGVALQQPNADFVKIQETWLKSLEEYVAEYPKSDDAAEAMLQLGVAREFAGQDDEAKAWYSRAAKDFPDSGSAKKAAGAVRRLDSVGKVLELRGTGADGKPVDLARYRGRVVLIHYWATWCEPCKQDIEQLKELQAKYGKAGFDLVGISLDRGREELIAYLKQHRLPWAQIFEPGGLDSRLANELGILTLPTMVLIDQSGKVVNRGIHVSQVEAELKSRLKDTAAQRPATAPSTGARR